MSEKPPQGPSNRMESSVITREEVIEAHKKFVQEGAVSPDDLDNGDPSSPSAEAEAATDLFLRWVEQEDARVKDKSEEEILRSKLGKTMFYVDAGFTDPDYLEEVLDWLDQDTIQVQNLPEGPERDSLLKEYSNAQEKVRLLLSVH